MSTGAITVSGIKPSNKTTPLQFPPKFLSTKLHSIPSISHSNITPKRCKKLRNKVKEIWGIKLMEIKEQGIILIPYFVNMSIYPLMKNNRPVPQKKGRWREDQSTRKGLFWSQIFALVVIAVS